MYHFGGSQPVSSLGIFSGRVQGSSSKPRVRNPSSPLRPPTAHRHSWRNPGHFAHRARNSQERQTRWRREMDSNYWSRQGRSPVWARHIVSGPLRPPSAKFPRETDSLAEEAGRERTRLLKWGEFPASWENTGNSSDSGLGEPICLAKRLKGSTTYQQNSLRHGTGN